MSDEREREWTERPETARSRRIRQGLEGTRGHITPGCIMRVPVLCWMYDRPGNNTGNPIAHLIPGSTAFVLARLNDPERADDGKRLCWDDLLVMSTTRLTAWIVMDPSDPEAMQLVSSPGRRV